MPRTRALTGSAAQRAVRSGDLVRQCRFLGQMDQPAIVAHVQDVFLDDSLAPVQALHRGRPQIESMADRQTRVQRLFWVVAAAIPLSWGTAQAEILRRLVDAGIQVRERTCHCMLVFTHAD